MSVNIDDIIHLDYDEIEKIKKETFKKVYENKEMFDFIKENSLSEEFVYKNVSYFSRVMKDKEKCKNCQGLNSCSKGGFILKLYYDDTKNKLEEIISRCNFKLENDNVVSKFIICETDKSYFNYPLKELLNYFASDRTKVVTKMAKIAKGIELNKGIYLYGEDGIGKTFMMSVFSKSLSLSLKDEYISYINCSGFFKDLSNNYRFNKANYEFDFEMLTSVKYLFLDNFMLESMYSNIKTDIILPLIKKRNELGLLTFYISNKSPMEALNNAGASKANKDIYNEIVNKNEIFYLKTSPIALCSLK